MLARLTTCSLGKSLCSTTDVLVIRLVLGLTGPHVSLSVKVGAELQDLSLVKPTVLLVQIPQMFGTLNASYSLIYEI